MPNLTVYVDNKTHSEFVNLTPEEQTELKEVFKQAIAKKLKKVK